LPDIFFERLCRQCYLENYPIIENQKSLIVVVCNHCELIFSRGHWTNYYLIDVDKQSSNSWISNIILRGWDFNYKPKEIKIQDIQLNIDDDGYPSNISGIVEIGASPDPFVPLLMIRRDFIIKIEWGECVECRTRFSGEYASKIQVRSPLKVEKMDLESWKTEIEAMSQNFPLSDGKNPLFKLEYLKSGLNALFQTRAAANSVGRLFSQKFGGTIKTTTEFAGFDKSKSREFPRKIVVRINLPAFKAEDILVFSQYLVQIIGIKDNKVEFFDFKKKLKRKLPLKTFLEEKPKLLEEDFEEYQLVNFEQNGSIAQIMNSKSFETLYVDSTEVKNLEEGEFFSAILFNDILLRKKENDY
jgi:nonsense-mediated mRNA decay protein 3